MRCNRILVGGLLGVLVVSGCSKDAIAPTILASDALFSAAPEAVPNQFIVVLKENVADVRTAASLLAAAHGGRVLDVREHAVRGFLAALPDGANAAMANDPRVALVEPNGIVRLPLPATRRVVGSYAPGGPGEQFSPGWNLDRIDQRALPLDGWYFYKYHGERVHAYLLGSGIRKTHAEFAGRVLPGYSIFDDGLGTADCFGQGTAVAGVIGGKTYGVAKSVWMHPIRVVDCAGVTNWWFVITGIDWVILNRIRPAVAEISYAGWLSSTLNLAIQRLVAANVEVAVAAGNGGGDACLMSPSSAPDAETVAATTSNDDRVASSNIGRCLDFFAPSEGVTSAWYTGDQDTKVFSGTSMATAHVAGAMALVRQAYPFIPAPSAGLILRNNATYGVVKNPGLNSPNYLLYTKWIPYPPPPPR